MKEKISAYFLQVRHLVDPMVRAQIMLDMFNTEHGENCKATEVVNSEATLDEALDRFFKIKECQYVKLLLEQYVDCGTFELPPQKSDTFQRLDRFKEIKSVLTELLPVKSEDKEIV